jgi:hypothetical protein
METYKNIKNAPWRSFLRGYAAVFDLSDHGIDRPDPSRGFERDGEALAGDLRRIGDCFRRAMDQVATRE